MSPKCANDFVTFYISYSIFVFNTVFCYKSVHYATFLGYMLTCIWRLYRDDWDTLYPQVNEDREEIKW